MNIEQIRRDTPGCDSIIHFNNAGASLMPTTVANAIRDYITKEEWGGGYEVAAKEVNELNKFYDYSAELLNCKTENIAFTTNATDSYNKALSSISFKAGDVVLVSENDYPSNYIAFLSLEKRFGIQLVRVRNAATGEIELDDLESKLKKHSPKLVSVTHVPTSSGLVQPIEEVGEIMKPYDTLFLVDACQSLGQMIVDSKKIGC